MDKREENNKDRRAKEREGRRWVDGWGDGDIGKE